MAISKVVYGNTTLIDITDTTATASDVNTGKYFYLSNGEKIQGTAVEGGATITETQDSGGGTIVSVDSTKKVTVTPLSVTQNGTYAAPSNEAYSPVIVNVSGGGGGQYAWFGSETTLVGRKLNKTINLHSDTTFDSWTASTTAEDIRAESSSADYEITLDSDHGYTYWIVTHYYIDYKYLSGATLKRIPRVSSIVYITCIYPYFTNETNLLNGNYDKYSTASHFASRGSLRYYDSAGNLNIYTSVTYGIYVNAYPSITSSTDGVFSFKLPAIKARSNSTYFNTSRKEDIDSQNTNLIVTSDVYKTPNFNSSLCFASETLRTDLTSDIS